jgi:hypothetical protein
VNFAHDLRLQCVVIEGDRVLWCSTINNNETCLSPFGMRLERMEKNLRELYYTIQYVANHKINYV